MSDVYRIGIAISMTNGVSGVLSAISRDMLGLNLTAKQLEGTLSRVKLAAIGAGAVMVSAAVLRGMGVLVSHGEKLVHQQALLRQQMPGADVAAATANAWKTAGDVLGSNVTDNLKLTRELIGILGTLEDAQKALPEVAKASLVLSTTTGRDSATSMQTLMKALELRGGVINPETGHIDAKQFGTELNAALKAMTASGGIVSPTDLSMVMKQAGPMARMMSPDTFYKTMMSVIMEMGGARAGTALTAFGRVAYGGIMPERNAKEMQRIGLFEEGKYHVGRGGHVMVDQNALRGMDILNTKGLDAWFQGVMKPALEKAGYTTGPQQMQELYRLLPTETARRLAGLFLQQHETVARDADLYDKANGSAAYGDLSRTDPTLRMKAFKEAWDNLLTALGAPMVETAYTALGFVTGKLNDLAQWAARHPDMVGGIEAVTVALAGLLGVGGVLAVGGAAAGALGFLAGPLGLAGLAVGILAVYAALGGSPGKSDLATKLGAMLPKEGEWLPAIGKTMWAAIRALNDTMDTASKEIGHGARRLFDAAASEVMTGLSRVTSAILAWISGLPGAAMAAMKGWVGQMIGPPQAVPPGGTLGALGAHPYFLQQSYVPPRPAANDTRPIQINSTINLDGRAVGHAATTYQARELSGPARGTTGFDIRETPMFPGPAAVAI